MTYRCWRCNIESFEAYWYFSVTNCNRHPQCKKLCETQSDEYPCCPALLHSWAPEAARATAADCSAPHKLQLLLVYLQQECVDWWYIPTRYTVRCFHCGYTSVCYVIWCSGSFGSSNSSRTIFFFWCLLLLGLYLIFFLGLNVLF